MKIAYQHLLKYLPSNPSIEEVSEKLFQLGHEHEINSEIFDIELIEANGDAQSTNLQFTVAYEDTDSIDIDETSIDGSTVMNTVPLRIKELVAQGINCGTPISNDSTVASGSISELRTVYRPATSDTVVTSVTAQSPTDTGEIFDSITVSQITTTKLVSGEDS